MPVYLRLFSWLLIGYAVFGKLVAYLGVPPLFVGEIFLGWGLLKAPIARALAKLATSIPFLLLVAFLFACSISTITRIGQFPLVDVLRDSVIWGYGVFAIVVASYLVLYPNLIELLLQRYGRILFPYIIIAPLVALASSYFYAYFPLIPGTTVPLMSQKPGDVQVHLAGIFVFSYLGFQRLKLFQLIVLLLALVVLGSTNRGGFVAFGCAAAVAMCLKPRIQVIAATVGATAITLCFFTFVHINFDFSGRGISTAQIGENLLSIFGGSSDPYGIGGTRQWRLDWWHEIIGYTFHGDYFWNGKGFGINLATSDGFQVDADFEALRSPHNSHMTFLARGGVPIFISWIVLQLAWAAEMLRLILKAKKNKDRFWENIGIFLLSYWTAMIVNMNFDVYLEGPMGGIWFWTIWGCGIAVQWLFRYRAAIFIDEKRSVTTSIAH